MGEVMSPEGLYMLKKKIKDCDEQLNINTLYNSDKNGQILQRHKLPKLT